MLAHAPPKRNRPPIAAGGEWELMKHLKQTENNTLPPIDSTVVILRITGGRISPAVQPSTDRELTEREQRLALAIADAAAAVLGAA